MSKIILLSNLSFDYVEIFDFVFSELDLDSNSKIAYIPSSSDFERKYYNEVNSLYKSKLNNDLSYFDIDKEYDPDTFDEIFKHDAIHLSGGIVHYFYDNIEGKNIAKKIIDYHNNGGKLIGVSAGAIILSPSLNVASSFFDESESYKRPSLGLFNFEFYPHVGHSENEIKMAKNYAKSNSTSLYACIDGSAISVDGDEVKLYSDVRKFT